MENQEKSDSQRASDITQLADLAREYMWDLPARRALEAKNVLIEPNRFYSQLPSIADIENSFEYRAEFKAKGAWWDETLFDINRVSEFMRRTQPYADEFDPPFEGDRTNPNGYFWGNPAFSYSDAMAYWCNIRAHQPNHIVEIGSGFSSLVAAKALEKNGRGKLSCIEPFPPNWLQPALPAMSLIKSPIQDISIDAFNDLFEDGDILMIDSTHTVKAGSDCLWIYLKLLPAIRADIFVHVHDIPLPYAASGKRSIESRINWVEPYLLMAYLLDNPRISIYFGSNLAANRLPEEAATFMGGKHKAGGGSLWFKQKGRS